MVNQGPLHLSDSDTMKFLHTTGPPHEVSLCSSSLLPALDAEWPADALKSVAGRFLHDVDMPDVATRHAVEDMCMSFHQVRVEDMCMSYRQVCVEDMCMSFHQVRVADMCMSFHQVCVAKGCSNPGTMTQGAHAAPRGAFRHPVQNVLKCLQLQPHVHSFSHGCSCGCSCS